MPKSKETKQDIMIDMKDYFVTPNPGLRSYFGLVRRGQPQEYRTEFGEGKSVEEMLSDWESSLTAIESDWPSLLEFENDMRSKVGPLSIMKPLEDRMEDIESYYTSNPQGGDLVHSRAIKAVLNELKQIKGLRLRDRTHTVLNMRMSTNSGAPFFRKPRRAIYDKYMRNKFTQVGLESTYFGGYHGITYQNAAILGWRGQEGGPSDEDVKQRVIWMFPLAVNIEELRAYQPLIESAQTFNLVPAWVSMDSVDDRITQLFDTKGPDDPILCTDFTRFDQHFGSSMQSAALQILDSLFSGRSDCWDYWKQEIFPIKYTIPLVYDYGKAMIGSHGMGSGSGGTNCDETLAHRALQFESAILNDQKLNPNSQCLGDDGILTFPGVTVDKVLRVYTSHGLEMNESKQSIARDYCIYLRRWHHYQYRIDRRCVGVYSTYRAIGRLCEQERFYDPDSWSKEMVALRQLSIIENCKYHPLFSEFVKWCMKRDKYRLGVDIPGFIEHITEYARKATDLMPDFLGYTKVMQDPHADGIATWKVVQLLKEFA